MRVVVEHPELGLFLGQLGVKLLWTENTVTHAVTEVVSFQNREQAEQFCAGHFSGFFDELKYHEIEITSNYAPIKSLIDAGLGHRTKKLLFFTRPAGYA